MKPQVVVAQSAGFYSIATDEQLCETIRLALSRAETDSWAVADGFIELSRRHWTQEEIGKRFNMLQPTVSKYIFCAEKYSHVNTRPRFPDALSEATGRSPRTLGTGQDEWYTPPEYIELVRKALGWIDLDPASCEAANAVVGAKTFYSQEQDGLTLPWNGRVFLNPPYSQPKIQQFIERLTAELAAKRVPEAITLTTNNTDTDWFQVLASNCAAICFTDGRVSFIAPDGRKPSPNQGHVFAYFGESPTHFETIFAGVGVSFRRF